MVRFLDTIQKSDLKVWFEIVFDKMAQPFGPEPVEILTSSLFLNRKVCFSNVFYSDLQFIENHLLFTL